VSAALSGQELAGSMTESGTPGHVFGTSKPKTGSLRYS
jgi:hypothetical protein